MVYCLILLGLMCVGPVVVIGVLAGLGALIGYIVTLCSIVMYVLAPIFRFIKRVFKFLKSSKMQKGVV